MRYVFTCIAEKKNDIYFLTFPDFDNTGICDANLYDALKIACNVITVETYTKEQERVVMSEPKSADELAKTLKEGQWTTCVAVDTGAFEGILELYDSVKLEDLQEFLKIKKEEYQTQIKALKKLKKTAIVESVEVEAKETAKAEPTQVQSLTDTVDFEDNVEVVPISEKPKESNSEKASVEKGSEKSGQPEKTDTQSRAKRQKSRYRYNNQRHSKQGTANTSGKNETKTAQNEENT